MLLRLLIALTLVGPTGPRVCTCASAKASRTAPTQTPAPASNTVRIVCECCRPAPTPSVPSNDTEFHPAAHPDHTAPAGHNPRCPAAQQKAPSDALAPAPGPNDSPSDALVCVSFGASAAYEAKPVSAFRAGRARSPFDPQFCTVHVMRN
ncbi:hypothetical protein FTUN_7046 [Frigoriglobus tundricola]|uniref:Uncharacterized protein n=1 Tax=Frigoriglobus tundricola TaxID=2774151 RepID=A0A6M5Z0V6_9BACT|nr:hypothetical protein FTUN_7046 [Frigoriglobus tundricola]